MALALQRLRWLDLVPGEGPGFIAAASGLAWTPRHFYVVADDGLELGVFATEGTAPGRRFRLFDGKLPTAHAERKAQKPDLESLCFLPRGPGWPRDALLALPSGSTANRRTGALVPLDSHGQVAAARAAPVDFGPLFDRLAKEAQGLNLEGAAIAGETLWLAQRGRIGVPSALFALELPVVLTALEQGVPPPPTAFRRAVPLTLGAVGEVPLTPTDLCALGDGQVLVCAAAEATANAYDDGAQVGAALVLLGSDLRPLDKALLGPGLKPEGLWAWRDGQTIEVRLVCDADDPKVPSPLLAARWAPNGI